MLEVTYPNAPQIGECIRVNGVRVAVLCKSYRREGWWQVTTNLHHARPGNTEVPTEDEARSRLLAWERANAARLQRETYREPVNYTSRLEEPFRLE
jgi:hypothetical protein